MLQTEYLLWMFGCICVNFPDKSFSLKLYSFILFSFLQIHKGWEGFRFSRSGPVQCTS